jgi:hypothetical protein
VPPARSPALSGGVTRSDNAIWGQGVPARRITGPDPNGIYPHVAARFHLLKITSHFVNDRRFSPNYSAKSLLMNQSLHTMCIAGGVFGVSSGTHVQMPDSRRGIGTLQR